MYEIRTQLTGAVMYQLPVVNDASYIKQSSGKKVTLKVSG